MSNALGIDVSRYNGLVDWAIAREHGVIFTGIRASISWGYRDPFITSNWQGAREAGIYRLAYHVLYPGESIERQVTNYLEAVGSDWERAWPVLDVELDHGVSISHITAAILNWCDIVESRLGKRPIIYSRANWIDRYTLMGAWRSHYHWWLAHYQADRTQERPAPPALPQGVSDWLIHQNSDKGEAWPGLQNGMSTVDRNRWNGDEQAVSVFFGAPPPQTWTQAIDAWARTMGYRGPAPL